jgi:hypothetical protein
LKVMALVPWPLVSVPPLAVQAYVAPATAGVLALLPMDEGQTAGAAENVSERVVGATGFSYTDSADGYIKGSKPFENPQPSPNPYVEEHPSRELGVRMLGDLHALLRESDWVSVQVPLNAETRHMLGEREFRAMKPSAYFVNCCRGGVVDEAALTRALQEGWIAGAGLDVFEQEPTDPANPLLRLENVIATPHAGGESTESAALSARVASRQAAAVLRGEWPDRVVNPAVYGRLRETGRLAR